MIVVIFVSVTLIMLLMMDLMVALFSHVNIYDKINIPNSIDFKASINLKAKRVYEGENSSKNLFDKMIKVVYCVFQDQR